MKELVIGVLLVGLLTCVSSATSLYAQLMKDTEWKAWKTLHSKTYTDINEETLRYVIWTDNAGYCADYNSKSNNVKLAMNQFGDLTLDEFRGQMNGYLTGSVPTTSSFSSSAQLVLPKEVNWVKKGYVTPVKNQGACASCWAFSVVGSIEGQLFKKTGKLQSLSAQQLLECSWVKGSHGCQGGMMQTANNYLLLAATTGISTEASYKYTGKKSHKCALDKTKVVAKVTKAKTIKSGDEKALQEAVATVGPISVAINASHRSFQFYKSGVYDEAECNAEFLDRAMLVVGYGSNNGKDYWLVKNSFGTSWGVNGYVLMSRNKSNQCGIATIATFPVLKTV